MFQLLNPIWLSAIAALSIPVVIHLWNIRPGKVLKVGSIAFIEASLRKSSRSFSLMDILLLLLRCLLLAVLALLLAQPFWAELVKPGKTKGWILIPRQNIHQVYTQFKPRVDSLTKAGYQLHYFNSGFAAIDTLKLKTVADSGNTAPTNNWALLQQLNQQVTAKMPLYLFTTNTLNSIAGIKPTLGLNLHIQTFIPADSTSKWIQSAALISTGDAIKITEGNSKPSVTTFTSNIVQSTEQRNSAYQININNGQPTVSFKGDTLNKAVIVDTTTLRIAIYSDKASDAQYLKAALKAVKRFTQRKISIQVSYNDAHLPGIPNWIFWLKERPVPLVIAENINNVFVYEPGKARNIHSWVNGDHNIAIVKLIAAQNTNESLWQDGFGNAILSLDKANIYHFYSRFDPSWNDLVWSDTFPQMMLNLLMDAGKSNIHDKRTIAIQQLTPHLTNRQTNVTETKLTTKTDLSKVFWLALVLLFLLERWLAHHNKSTPNYG